MIQTTTRKKLLKIVCTGILASLGTMSMALKPKPSLGAERIVFSIPILGEFYLSVDSLEVFAREGKITRDFNFYAKRLDQKSLTRFRAALQKQFKLSPTTVFRVTKMSMGEQFLNQIGEVIYTHPERNGLYAIRSALILAAADSEGLTVINFLRKFPGQDIQVNTKLLLSLVKKAGTFLAYKDTTVKAIAQQADREIASQQGLYLGRLPDLRQRGSYSVAQKAMSFKIKQVRQTQVGFALDYTIDADIYLPENLTQPAPLLVFSHGFTSDRLHYQYLAEHLASHGYIIVVPEHIGSNSEFKEAFLRGELSVDVSPLEFFNRPLDITYLLNRIENHPEFQGLVNWEQVGVLGHSFGGNTALVLSGAPINQARISQVCLQPTLNVSVLLQCRASYLPPGDYNLQDPRIKAVFAVSPVTSSILGPESMSKIPIPTMILGGTQDYIAPFIDEQAHPFLWLTTQNKYLGVMDGGSHNSTSSEERAAKLPKFLKGVRPDLARGYLKTMSLAFFEVHLRARSDYQPYLSSAYARTISTEELPFHLVKSLTPEQLELAYGRTPPIPPIPEAVVAVSPRKQRNILAQIQDTKTLKIGMRTDAAPFGYIDSQEDLWTGYCEDLADSLGQYLAEKLNIDSGLEVIKLPSSLENRFELVQQNTVHLECGPNTIRTDQKDVRFSELFFATGTRFLVTNGKTAKVNLNSSLEKVQIGVLPDTTTAQFVQETYPEAEVVYFQGEQGRMEGVTAITNGSIDTFVSDGVLLLGEIARQNLALDNYQLIPEEPLTCDFYGLILPRGDRQWRNLVNAFLRDESERELWDKWLEEHAPKAVSDLDYCLNR
ncbi:MAG: alpha/beta hydrolase [Xenococcaceae cyanobacterium MO_234.B1]|nr:alpha/beta hydrolase [Xenococcaceae cyanobacterium MO_234.B1]